MGYVIIKILYVIIIYDDCLVDYDYNICLVFILVDDFVLINVYYFVKVTICMNADFVDNLEYLIV